MHELAKNFVLQALQANQNGPAPTFSSDGGMLLVDGEPVLPFSAGAGATATSRTGVSGRELVAALAGSPALHDAADRLKAAPERRISAGQEGAMRHVYVFQREYATVDPPRVELVGTDEVTTCVSVVIRNNKTGMTSVSHLDF